MILRKPYAFLVKHFKFIHVLLTLVLAFLFYRTMVILNFLNEYIASSQTSVIDNLTNTIFSIWMFFLPFLIIVLSIIIISLMAVKKKPIVLYIFNIILAIAILILYNISYSVFAQMEAIILEARTIRLLRDFIAMLEIFQLISMIMALIRATGFDIKKFNFNKDLVELEIEETDNEEFEINLEVDTNEVQRKVNRIRRFAKYIYYENKFLIDVGILVGISTICFAIYMSIGIYDREVEENTMFSTTSFHLGITKSYMTNKDYKGNFLLDDEILVVLELTVRSKGKPKKFDTAMATLKVGNRNFYHNEKYKENIMDLGHTYLDSLISSSFEKHLLVFKIPKEFEDEKMTFIYTDRIDYVNNGVNSKYIRLKIEPIKIDTNVKQKTLDLGSELNFKNSVFEETKMSIKSAQIEASFRENYQFCASVKECYTSAEFINPNYNSNDEKAILKINGTLEIDDDVVLDRIYTLYHLIYYFSTLKYEKDGKIITQSVTMNRVRPSKFNPQDIYYIEVAEDTMNADKIWLHFHVRNKEYDYQIK